MNKSKNYSKCYSDAKFWEKMKQFAATMGKGMVFQALKLYYAVALKKAKPEQIAAIVAALGYLISPLDAVPDLIPGVGFADDAGVLALAIGTISACADPEVVEAAEAKLEEWFG